MPHHPESTINAQSEEFNSNSQKINTIPRQINEHQFRNIETNKKKLVPQQIDENPCQITIKQSKCNGSIETRQESGPTPQPSHEVNRIESDTKEIDTGSSDSISLLILKPPESGRNIQWRLEVIYNTLHVQISSPDPQKQHEMISDRKSTTCTAT